jgi:hypothetical protein
VSFASWQETLLFYTPQWFFLKYEVVEYSKTILVLVVKLFGHAFVKQFISADIRRKERIILPHQRNVIANQAFVTDVGMINHDGAVFVQF